MTEYYLKGKKLSKKDFVLKSVIPKVSVIRQFKKGDTALPGTMVWADAMGRFHREGGYGLQSDLTKSVSSCKESTFIGADKEGHYIGKFTRDHLYFIAKGMGFKPTRAMKKAELCQLIVTGKKSFKQAPF